MGLLPTEVIVAGDKSPANLVLVSHQGVGKSSAIAALPNCLLIDLESGTGCISAMKIDVKKVAGEQGKHVGQVFMEVLAEIKAMNREKGGFVYDFVAFDTLTALEAIASTKATNDFKVSVVGRGMLNKGAVIRDVVADIAEGGGYRWLFNSFNELYESCKGLAKYGVIFCGHTKQGSLMKDGQKVEARDMSLTGKLKIDLLRDCDACGYVWRKDANTVMVTFKVNEQDLTTKARAPHLAGKEFILSTLNPETEELTVNWNLIYPDWVKSPVTIKR